MAENKFIQHLKGEHTAGSLVEIKNQATPASFGNMPLGTSDSTVKYSDHRGNATVVANGTMCWKINDSALTPAPVVSGDGNDYTSIYNVSGSGLWVNATYTFPSTGDPNHPVAMIFNPNTKWVLKLCGDNLVVENGNTVDFTLVITIGTSNIITKQFTVSEQANHFCKELVIDFAESNTDMIKAQGLSTMRVQVLCGTAGASARIYNGMTVFTVLQRKVDASAVSSTFANVEEVLRDGILPSDYFSNTEFIDQIEDGEDAYAVFTRDGDSVNLSGWTPKDEIATKEMVIVKSPTMPEPNADLLGAMYQYVGETSGAFEHAYIYECTLTPANTLIFTPSTMSCSWEDLSAFLQTITPDYDNVVKGSMTYLFAGDLWKLEVLDENDSVIATYQQYTPDWENVGFSFVGTPQDGDVVSFVKTSNDTYNWVRTDVQPGGSRGRFLSLWDCTTGLAESNPPISPYEYKTGDYFIVGKVSTATPPVNYKPDGTSYVAGQASSVVETNEVAVDDTYFFDGTTWRLQSNSNKTVTYSNIAGDIYDNASAANALNNKVNKTSTASQVYATDSNGAQTTLTYGAGVVNGGLVQRGGTSGQIQVPVTPTSNVHATSKQYVDNELADKVDKVNTATVLYGTTSGGGQTTLSYGASVSDLMIVRRPVGGQINVPLAPTDNAHATSKKYVDDGLAGKQDTISDLATIRSGAAAGATAVQPGDNVSDLTNDAGYLVMSDLTNFVTRTTAQTISGLKTFSADIVLSGTTSIKNTTSGVSYTMMYRDTSGIHVGTSTQALLLAGSGSRPTFNGNNVAMSADIPTVNNPTITITQGGVTKGSFTLNQASGDTIALDAGGGGSGLPDQTGQAGKFLTTDGTDASWSDKPLVNTATGTDALSVLGTATTSTRAINIGYNSTATKNYAIGIGASATASGSNSFALAYNANASGNWSIALGTSSVASNIRSIAIGESAKSTATAAIQIGKGTNNESGTLCVGSYYNGSYVSYKLLDSNGTIPEARLADTTSATAGQVLTLDSNLDATWATPTASVAWGGITGTLSDQTDLQNALDAKADVATTYTKTETDNALKALVPAGTVLAFSGTTTPAGYLVCDGSAVSRTTYADLFAAIGTTYGAGDGSTTFNLPDTDDRTINGAGTETLGAVSNGSLPQINGAFNAYTYNTGNPSGAFTASIQTAKVLNSGSQNNLNINTFTFSASNSSSVYWRSDNKVRARSIYMNHIIKY